LIRRPISRAEGCRRGQRHGTKALALDFSADDSLLQVGDLDLERHLPGATASFMSTNIFAHVEATRAGGGIGLLPAFMANRHPELVRLLPKEVDVHLTFSLAARRESLTNPTVRAVRDAIHAEAARRRTDLLPPT